MLSPRSILYLIRIPGFRLLERNNRQVCHKHSTLLSDIVSVSSLIWFEDLVKGQEVDIVNSLSKI